MDSTAQSGLQRGQFLEVTPAELDAADRAWLDALDFGVIGLDEQGRTEIYNATEARYAGLPAAWVLGKPFFISVGVCMNNFMVAQRFEDEERLDAVIDYVLTFRMKPSPVTLRLLREPNLRLRYILIKR